MVNDIAWGYFVSGDWGSTLMHITNVYMPYNIFWLLLGFTIYTILDAKSQNSSLVMVTMMFYFVSVSQLMNWFGTGTEYFTVMNAVGLFLIFVLVLLVYRLYKGRG